MLKCDPHQRWADEGWGDVPEPSACGDCGYFEPSPFLNDEKFMQAALVIDGALAGVAAFYSIPAALFMMALLIYAAINL